MQRICLIDGPKADFYGLPDTICKNQIVNFKHAGKGGYGFHWEFGDGTTSDLADPPPHQYTQPGIYTVLLTVTDMGAGWFDLGVTGQPDSLLKPCGCRDSISKKVVVVDQGPEILLDCCFGTVLPGDTSSFCSAVACSTYVWKATGGTILAPGNTQCIKVKWNTVYTDSTTVSLTTPHCTPCNRTTTLNVPVLYISLPMKGQATVCVGSSGSYSLPVLPGTYYDWHVLKGSSLAPPNDYSFNLADRNVTTVNITFKTSGTYQVHCGYHNPLAVGAGASSFVVEVLPVFSITGPDVVCQVLPWGQFFASGSATWTITPTVQIFAGPVQTNYISFPSPGTYIVTATAFPQSPAQFCNPSASVSVEVIANPILGAITCRSDSICPGKNYTYRITSNTKGHEFDWHITGGSIVQRMGADKDSVVVRWGNSGNYRIWLYQTIQPYGCTSYQSKDVYRWLMPDIDFNLNGSWVPLSGGQIVCVDSEWDYSGGGSNQTGHFEWAINPPGQGTIVSGQGTNTVRIRWHGTSSNAANLSVTTCRGSVSYPVVVKGIPVTVTSNIDPPFFCLGDQAIQNIILTANLAAGNCTYQWHGDYIPTNTITTMNTLSFFNFNFTVAGTYEYWVEITQNGCPTVSNRIKVKLDDCYCPGCNDPLVIPAGCSAAPRIRYYFKCDDIWLIDASKNIGNVVTRTWSVSPSGSFSPGANDPNPVLTVPASGQYVVTLTINDNAGCTNSVSIPIDIQLPTADFTYSSPICVNSADLFIALPNSNNNMPRYYWDFGDNTYSMGDSPSKAYSNASFFPVPVKLTIDDKYGCQHDTTKFIVVNGTPNCPIWGDTLFCPGGFETLSTISTLMLTYQWFKDSVAISGATNYAYDVHQHGEYWLEVTDITTGCSGRSNSMNMYVLEPPDAKIVVNSKRICAEASKPVSVWLWAETYNSTYIYDWSLLPGGVVSGFQPNGNNTKLTLNMPADLLVSYFVVLTVTDDHDCVARDTICLTFYEIPVLNSILPMLNICEGGKHLLTPDPNNTTLYSYLWSTGEKTPVITAQAPGYYALKITDKLTGCYGSNYAGYIHAKPDLTLFPTGCDTICDTDSLEIYIPLPLNAVWPLNDYPSAYSEIKWYDGTVYLNRDDENLAFNYKYPQFFPVPGDHHISTTVKNAFGCTATSDEFCLHVVHCEPTFALICVNEIYHCNVTPNNPYSTLMWTTSGTGSFSNPEILHPDYTPSATDSLVTLTLHAQPPPAGGDVYQYEIIILYAPCDWGDALGDNLGNINRYPTYNFDNGARHAVVTNIRLGASIDSELDGLSSRFANGDDLNNLNDEDGVKKSSFKIYNLVPGNNTVEITASVGGSVVMGYMSAWVDFDKNFIWDPGERVWFNKQISPGTHSYDLQIPAGTPPGTTYARFRFSDYIAIAKPAGPMLNGEVEDYQVYIDTLANDSCDFGDVPDINISGLYHYPVKLQQNGARHKIVAGVYLGLKVDPEPDGQPGTGADCDDYDCVWISQGDDEEGFLPSYVQQGEVVPFTIISSVPGFLDAWIDFNKDGDWGEPVEHIYSNKQVSGSTPLTFTVPDDATMGVTYARFRFRTSPASIGYDGLVADGEVEDYKIFIEGCPSASAVGIPVFVLGPTSSRYQGAGTVTYTASAVNTTGITYSLDANSLAGGNNINPATGAVTYVGAWSGITTITASAAGCGGPKTATHKVTVHCTVPANYDIINFTIGSSQSQCFNATQTITVAGNVTTFTVENGGSAVLIAGENINPTCTPIRGMK